MNGSIFYTRLCTPAGLTGITKARASLEGRWRVWTKYELPRLSLRDKAVRTGESLT